MSIYATLWILKFPEFGEHHYGCRWTEATAQGVPPDIGGAIRLYLLDRPCARRFWRAFTAEEIAESERIAAEHGGLFAACKKKRGDSYFLPEAFSPEHRRQRFMGELLPHQWVEIYHSCECSEFIQYWIKFSDGIAVECGMKQPPLGWGFFNEASEFDL